MCHRRARYSSDHYEQGAFGRNAQKGHLRAAMKYLSTMGPAGRLRLYQEVTVAAADDQHVGYSGWRPGTGLLRVLPATVAG
jgi:hypothetical protein